MAILARMRKRSRRLRRPTGPIAVAAASIGLAAAAAPLAGAASAPVRTPASGKYGGHSGAGRQLTLWVSGKSVQIVAFRFVGCHRQVGATSLDDIPLHRGANGYRFAIDSYGGVTYADPNLDDNAKVTIAGQFDRTGRSVRGTLTVRSPGCPKYGPVGWSAKR